MNDAVAKAFIKRNGSFGEYIGNELLRYSKDSSKYHFHCMMYKIHGCKYLNKQRSETLRVLAQDWFEIIESRHCEAGLKLIRSIVSKKPYPFRHPNRFMPKESTASKAKAKRKSSKQPYAKIIYVPQGGKNR